MDFSINFIYDEAMDKPFDIKEARENLAKKEHSEQESFERQRRDIMVRTLSILKDFFKEKEIEVFLVGSLTLPGKFTPNSDIDIVLKNFHGDRFEVWAELERQIGRKVEIILYEKCTFQDHVDEYGIKVI